MIALATIDMADATVQSWTSIRLGADDTSSKAPVSKMLLQQKTLGSLRERGPTAPARRSPLGPEASPFVRGAASRMQAARYLS